MASSVGSGGVSRAAAHLGGGHSQLSELPSPQPHGVGSHTGVEIELAHTVSRSDGAPPHQEILLPAQIDSAPERVAP